MSITAPPDGARVKVGGFEVDGLTEQQVVGRVMESLDRGDGGWIVTLNVDICQAIQHDPALADLASDASISVPDGMPLVWAARLCGEPLAERVTGSSLIFSLSDAASRVSRSVYLLGGALGVPDAAGAALAHRYPGLVVAGSDSPPLGFDMTAEGLEPVREKLVAAAPDIVFVGMGFPKQEKLIQSLVPHLPGTWFVACGAAIPMAAGTVRRAPKWVQKAGLEWMFRLLSEPRRLFTRYVVRDLPFATVLLVSALRRRSQVRRRASLE
jgi:N-acetylglucosaminyldiphosphoundecaprenol N-acetyl-beta-D-mannosaminyltransferase